ncbi:hypothetical protein [Bdellovibrio sp. HCB209]|uniref:hypothetical protein n=1 Tax=Bdellovibrio sp. HCB209 TaxID=3394354 RepID=UPI0039B4EE7E
MAFKRSREKIGGLLMLVKSGQTIELDNGIKIHNPGDHKITVVIKTPDQIANTQNKLEVANGPIKIK